jgi:hypothetical protein
MEYDVTTWLNLSLRWLHVIAGVAWIGASFYFVWLDNNLRAPVPQKDGVKGELWAVHGGGFYHSQKYMTAPAHMPDHLHWFKWEAYTTWLSGFALLIVLYYVGAPVYLIDAVQARLQPGRRHRHGPGLHPRRPAGLRGPVPLAPRAKAAPVRPGLVPGLTAATWALTQLFSDRGAFIHVGAIIGTVHGRQRVPDHHPQPAQDRRRHAGRPRGRSAPGRDGQAAVGAQQPHDPAGHLHHDQQPLSGGDGPSAGLAAAGDDQRRRGVDPVLLHPAPPRDHQARLLIFGASC